MRTFSLDCRNLYLNEEISGTLQAKSTGGFSYNYLNPVFIGVPMQTDRDRIKFHIIDSNPTDSRLTILQEDIVPTVTAHIHKASAVGPLVLIEDESICNREPCDRQQNQNKA